MADNEVDVILQNYFAAIAEKDSDALKLYEDNKRMRRLVEQTLKAREELEAQHCTTQLLVTSLQNDLREKQHIIETQDKAIAVWRDGIAELRSALERPSEVDHGLSDVVDDVRRMSAELRSLRQGMQYAQWCCNEWEGYLKESLVASEARERRALESSAAHSLQALCEAAAEVRRVWMQAAAQEAATGSTIARWEAWHATAQQERESAAEKHAQALHRAELEVLHHARRAEAAHKKADEMVQRMAAHEQEERVAHEWRALEAKTQVGLVDLLVRRCTAAEEKWCDAVREVRTVAHRLQRTMEELSRLSEVHEQTLVEQEQNRLRVSKLAKKVEQLKEQQSEMEALQQRCSSQQEELQALRDKYVAIADKERNLRYQLSTSTENAAAKLLSVEESLQAAERRATVLEERLRTTQEARAAQKDIAALRRQVEQHHATDAVLKVTQQQLRETEKHAFNFKEALEVLKAEHQAQLQAERDRHAAEIVALAEANEDALQSQTAEARARVVEAEERMQRAQETAMREKEALQRELQAWTAEVDTLKSELARGLQRAEAEKTAREVLEQQNRSEASVVRSMVELSFDDARRGLQVAELQGRLKSVQQRNRLLEEACRRSAGVIAQLREALYREQMTLRALRLKDDSLSA
ncbi:conserved hypothetical protein [Leishmania major strain Friedlin]|uniref:Uncharacterized protein n=1 Tax=Leishmania major TaxID=5664 RepID=Q4Q8B3_LEIMA|nr:conserved hypothetical protein [Leishmania major strain Friedlin]CAG9577262.1 hypothetical_protein_-_conserved [Leishmania major strain Friedlin]CAJ05462.1 conserved hypothetical protein [Leishmania major strain Friedlin]|eukprot:XP_001684435.1 conserved hypothetical protein [Leishmania major strain Friedlin]